MLTEIIKEDLMLLHIRKAYPGALIRGLFTKKIQVPVGTWPLLGWKIWHTIAIHVPMDLDTGSGSYWVTEERPLAEILNSQGQDVHLKV